MGCLSRLRDSSARGLLRHAIDFSAAALWLRLRWRPSSFEDERCVLAFRCRRNPSLMLAYQRARRFWDENAGGSPDVLLATSVTKVLIRAMMKLTTSGSRTSRPEVIVRSARSWERPDFLVMSARAKPPPSSRITPQGRRFSTRKQTNIYHVLSWVLNMSQIQEHSSASSCFIITHWALNITCQNRCEGV